MQTSVHIFCQPRCSCSWGPRSSSSTSSPLISSQQKELKSISSAKVMCSCSWINKNGNNFITIISSSRWWKWKVSPVCAVSGLTNGNSNFNIKKPRESSRRPENRREAQRSLKKPWENPRRHEKPREASRRPEKALLEASPDTLNFAKVRYQLYCLYVCLPRLRKLWFRC